MFQGMASGHSSLSTFHAGSLETVIKRLIAPPISLPPTLIESLDAVVVMVHAKEKGKSARRIKEIIEIVGVDPKTDEVKTNVVFRWDPAKDEFEKVNESIKIETLAKAYGASKEDALREIEIRKKILDWMLKNGITDYAKVTEIINTYYKEPEKILEKIKVEKIEKPVVVKKEVEKKVEKPKKKRKIWEIFGFKVIRE